MSDVPDGGQPSRLSELTLHSVRETKLPDYDRSATRIGIFHIGPGAFHRSHQASYVDALLHSDPRWAISALSLRNTGVRDALMPQDGLYTLTTLGTESQRRVIGAIREVLVATQDRDAAFARLAARDTRMVTLSVTEKGYCLDVQGVLDESHPDVVHDWQSPDSPRSIYGWSCEALRRRRALGVPAFTLVSCDNLSDNGSILRQALIAFAAHSDRDLAKWIEGEVAFPRTMVDSITPATDDVLRRQVADATGITDAWPIQREQFTQWVMEDLPAVREADWRSVGVTLTADVSVYERAKLRLLNGAHTTIAYVGLLLGHATVTDAMNDKLLARFVEKLMREDIAPNLGATGDLDIGPYIDSVLARFRNPGIRHFLSQIAWDGSKKIPVRLMSTIMQAMAARLPIQRLVLPIAAWMRFVARQAQAGTALVDPEAARLAEIGLACRGDAEFDVGLFMEMDAVIPASLAADSAFTGALKTAYRQLATPQAALGLCTL